MSKMPHGLPCKAVLALMHVFNSYPDIKKVILYGSRATGNYKNASDIDLCLDAPSLTLTDLFQIEIKIDDLLLPWKVDLSLKHLIDNDRLIMHIDKAGIIFT